MLICFRHPFVEDIEINLWTGARLVIVVDNGIEPRIRHHEAIPHPVQLNPGILSVRKDVAAIVSELARGRDTRIIVDAPKKSYSARFATA